MSLYDRAFRSFWHARDLLRKSMRPLRYSSAHRNIPAERRVSFSCNICAHKNMLPREELGREAGSCAYCGATVRWRSVIHALSSELFGKSLPLVQFPERKDIRGVGLSDWLGYAEILARKFDYQNTYYHRRPHLDISNPDPSLFGKYDFLISTDVFEHVPPPVASAFDGAWKILRPGGVMIFTVPYVDGDTREHFPELYRFQKVKRRGQWILSNETAGGRVEEFTDLTFHGGPGATVEMRVFGKASLLAHFRDARFERIHQYSEEVPDFGILWIEYDPHKAPYHPPIFGLDTPPWAARRPLQ
jgi:SAM-dependent methyltransferase